MSLPDDDTLLAIVALCLKQKELENGIKKTKKQKRIWMIERQNNSARNQFTHQNILRELRISSKNDLRNILKIEAGVYEELFSMIGPLIRKKDTTMRQAIPASLRLMTTLRFLATGSCFENMKISSAMSPSAISRIVLETCKAIVSSLKNYVKVPHSQEEWLKVSLDFQQKFNFPHCLGAVAGTHINIDKPTGSDSLYYNYEHYFSIILLVVVNAHHEFLITDVGLPGSLADAAEAFSQSSFGQALQENTLNIPQIQDLDGHPLPYVFVADERFELTENFILPYAEIVLTKDQTVYNDHLGRLNRLAENAMGILKARFGVLQRRLKLSPEKVQTIVLACCYLHNFLCRKSPDYLGDGIMDQEDLEEHTLVEGSWRQVAELTPLPCSLVENVDDRAIGVREAFKEFFNNRNSL